MWLWSVELKCVWDVGYQAQFWCFGAQGSSLGRLFIWVAVIFKITVYII